MLQRAVELDESCVPREWVQHRTAMQTDDAPQCLEEVVEMERLAPHEQELQLTAVHMAEMFPERYGDRDACFTAQQELKAQLVARSEIMDKSGLALATVPFFFEQGESICPPGAWAAGVAPLLHSPALVVLQLMRCCHDATVSKHFQNKNKAKQRKHLDDLSFLAFGISHSVLHLFSKVPTSCVPSVQFCA